jgi:ATP-binding protein involved in chromosome partitioning
VQSTSVHAALIVTTPQQVATGDALRGVKMFQRVGVPVLGIVENMSYFECPHCGKPSSIFGAGGGERLAQEVGLPLLAQIPLDPRIVEGGDTGRPLVVAEPGSSAAKVLVALSERVATAMATATTAATAAATAPA